MQATFQEQYAELNGLIQRWDRRTRWQQTVYWLPRSLVLGLVAGSALLLFARVTPMPTTQQLLVLTAVLVGVAVAVMLAIIWLRPHPTLANARRFDLEFGLGERISTALELIEGQIHARDELVTSQIADARTRGQAINAGEKLPLPWDRRAWFGVLVALVMLVVLALLPNDREAASTQNTAQQAAIAEASDEVERITEEVAADTNLSEEEREQLLQELERTNEILEEEEVTPEEAFAALSETQSQLEEQSQQLQDNLRQQQEALQQASDSLQEQNQGAPPGQQQEQIVPTLQELQDQLPQQDEQQQMGLADRLEQAADALEQSNPQAAQALRDAAEALRNGDQQAAQEALQEAAESLGQQQQNMQQQQQSQQQMQQNAQQMQQSAEQVAQQGQQQQQQSQQAQQQGQEGQTDEGLQQLEQSQSQQSGEQPGGQQSESQQAQPGQQGQQGQQPGEQGEGQQQSQQSGQQGQQPGQQSQQGQQPGEGSAAGDQQGGDGMEQGTQGQPPPGQDNNPDGEGEGTFESVYAPQRAGGEGGPELFLEPESSDVPLTEGEFAENPSGEALVPYNQVFSDYSDAANRALESDYIPLGLRDVVRDYFTSLEPGQ